MDSVTTAPVDAPARASAPTDGEHYFVLHGISWTQYVTMRDLLDEVPGLRMTYLKGTLELMSPSRRHEQVKTLTARLVEIYAVEREIDLNGYGSTTFRKAAEERGLEPDECWCLGDMREFPDIAFEVVITSGSIDRLQVYAGLQVPEVWYWQDGRYRIYRLGAAGYAERAASEFLPGLDFAVLARFAERPDQTQAVREFRDLLRAAK